MVETLWIKQAVIKTFHTGHFSVFSFLIFPLLMQVVSTGYPRKNVGILFAFDPFLDIVQTAPEFFTGPAFQIFLDFVDSV